MSINVGDVVVIIDGARHGLTVGHEAIVIAHTVGHAGYLDVVGAYGKGAYLLRQMVREDQVRWQDKHYRTGA